VAHTPTERNLLSSEALCLNLGGNRVTLAHRYDLDLAIVKVAAALAI
jgi:hypothetical protein